MIKRVRIFLAIIILAASLSLLVWGFMPNPHETRVQPIAPAEMQLPTPSSFHFDLLSVT